MNELDGEQTHAMDLLLHNLRTGGTRHDDWSVAREAADEIERLRKLLDRIAVRNPDGSVAIRLTDDALNAAAEYLTPNAEVSSAHD